MRALFLTSDLVAGHIGRSQIEPYCRGLVRAGFEVAIIDPAGVHEVSLDRALAPRTAAVGNPGSRLAKLLAMAMTQIRRRKVDLLHARSYEAAVAADIVCSITKVPWIFDMRGFWFDEKALRVPALRQPLVSRALHSVERRLLQSATAIISLTQAAKEWLSSYVSTPIYVIPTSVDLSLFRPSGEVGDDLVYSGSLGDRYELGSLLEFFRTWQCEVPGARLIILSKDDTSRARHLVEAMGLGGSVDFMARDRAEIPEVLGRCRAAAMFYTTGVHAMATAPTKLGEYLACQVPVVTNGIGDIEDLSQRCSAVVLAKGGLPDASARLRAAAFDEAVRERARGFASEVFDLDRATARYAEVYARVADGSIACS